MRIAPLAACGAGMASLALASAAMAKPPDVDSSELRSRVTVDRIVAHQRALQSIATMNGGTRYTQTPGYATSVNYVQQKMTAAGYNVSVVQFNMPGWRENSPPVFEQLTPSAKTYRAGTEADDNSSAVDYITFQYSPSKEVASAPVVPTTDYHEACDNIDTITGQPPASTMNTYATNPALAQQQADSLHGNALKSLREMSGAVTHAVWYFARVRDALPPRGAAARAARRHVRTARTYRFRYEGHRRARLR